MLKSFLEKERADKNQYPLLKPKGFEVEVSAYWDQQKGELSRNGNYLFKGYIDRIDQDEAANSYIIRDYKASPIGLNHISSWIKKDREEFQLTFYAQALQKGLVENFPGEQVSALFYSVYKKDFLARGFVDKNSSLEKLMDKNMRGHKQERDVLSQAIAASNKRTQVLVQWMEEGRFSPKPKNKTICKKCLYRTWCRVETLEQ